jgi:hypothetical protein
MSTRLRNNLLATLFVVVVLALLVVLGGCAGEGLKINVETSGEGVNATKSVQVNTDYQVENGFTMERDGDGYKIELGSATTKDAETGVMIELLRMVQGLMAVTVPGFNGGQAAAPALVPPDNADVIYEAGIKEGQRLQSKQFRVDEAGNVWINGRINPPLPLKSGSR